MITNFKQYNEGINHLLVGPTEEEIWDNYMNGDLKGLLKSVPTSPEDFFNKMKDGCIEIGKDKYGTCYGKNNIVLFQLNLKNGYLYVNLKYIWSILEKYYNLNYEETQSLITNQLEDTTWNGLINFPNMWEIIY